MGWRGFMGRHRWRIRWMTERRSCWSAIWVRRRRRSETDGKAWRRIFAPLAENWREFAGEVLGPALHLPRHPWLLGRFGMNAVLPATVFCRLHFKSARTRALFAGLAAHSFLSLDEPLSAAVGLVLAGAGHAVGWPVPRGGAQAITDALVGHLRELGGEVHLSRRIGSVGELPQGLVLCDVSPRQLMAIAGERLSASYRRSLERFKLGPASVQGGLRAVGADSVAGEGVWSRDYGSPRRDDGGDCAIGVGDGAWAMCRAAICAGGAAEPVRSDAGSGGQAYGVGLLPCSEWVDGRYDAANRGPDRAVCSGISRLRAGAACVDAGVAGVAGCEPGRRRYQRRGDVGAADNFAAGSSAVFDFGPESLFVLFVDASGGRGAWDVRLLCGAGGAATVGAVIPDLGLGWVPPPPPPSILLLIHLIDLRDMSLVTHSPDYG